MAVYKSQLGHFCTLVPRPSRLSAEVWLRQTRSQPEKHAIIPAAVMG